MLPVKTNAKPSSKDKRAYQKHGLTVLKRAVKELGSRMLDGRTALAKELAEERAEVSPQEAAIIDMIAQKRVRRKIAAQWALLNRDRLFNRKKMKMAPIALELEQLEESEARLLDKRGLKRRAKPIITLQDYLAKRSGEDTEPSRHEDLETKTKQVGGLVS